MLLLEGGLHRVELAVLGQALDGGDLGAVGLDGEHGAALHRLAVDVDHAGATLTGVAAHVRAGEPQCVAEDIHEQGAGFDIDDMALLVDLEGDHDGATSGR